jgi:histone H3/H4
MAEVLVVASKVKEAISKAGFNTSGDFVEALSRHVEEEIKKAIERCRANSRKTVRPEDI